MGTHQQSFQVSVDKFQKITVLIMIELDKIYNMDCLEGRKQIPDGTIDAVICDLP